MRVGRMSWNRCAIRSISKADSASASRDGNVISSPMVSPSTDGDHHKGLSSGSLGTPARSSSNVPTTSPARKKRIVPPGGRCARMAIRIPNAVGDVTVTAAVTLPSSGSVTHCSRSVRSPRYSAGRSRWNPTRRGPGGWSSDGESRCCWAGCGSVIASVVSRAASCARRSAGMAGGVTPSPGPTVPATAGASAASANRPARATSKTPSVARIARRGPRVAAGSVGPFNGRSSRRPTQPATQTASPPP